MKVKDFLDTLFVIFNNILYNFIIKYNRYFYWNYQYFLVYLRENETMTEVWKDIKGYEVLYQVSSIGRVKSLNFKQTGKEQVLRCCKDKDGYLMVNLCKNGKQKTAYGYIWKYYDIELYFESKLFKAFNIKNKMVA